MSCLIKNTSKCFHLLKIPVSPSGCLKKEKKNTHVGKIVVLRVSLPYYLQLGYFKVLVKYQITSSTESQKIVFPLSILQKFCE